MMRLEEIVSHILHVPISDLTDDSSQTTVSSWNSLAHINLMTALEETYGISFSTQEILSVKTLGNLRQLVRSKGASS